MARDSVPQLPRSVTAALVVTAICWWTLAPAAAGPTADAAGDSVATSTPAATAADSIAPASVTVPDTLWAWRVATESSLDSTRARHESLLAADCDGFARVRADFRGYWYEVFAGPVIGRAEADSLATKLRAAAWPDSLTLVHEGHESLLRGTVVAPTLPVMEALVARPTTPSPGESAGAVVVGEGTATGPSPRILELVQPIYPERARQDAASGTVIVEVQVGVNGEVRNLRLKQSVHHVLDAEAMQAAAKCRFAPAMVDGEPVTAWIEIPFEFSY